MDASFIPGLLHAADICDQFCSENAMISHNEILRICRAGEEMTMEKMDHSVIHTAKSHAAREIAAFLRRLVSEGGRV